MRITRHLYQHEVKQHHAQVAPQFWNQLWQVLVPQGTRLRFNSIYTSTNFLLPADRTKPRAEVINLSKNLLHSRSYPIWTLNHINQRFHLWSRALTGCFSREWSHLIYIDVKYLEPIHLRPIWSTKSYLSFIYSFLTCWRVESVGIDSQIDFCSCTLEIPKGWKYVCIYLVTNDLVNTLLCKSVIKLQSRNLSHVFHWFRYFQKKQKIAWVSMDC